MFEQHLSIHNFEKRVLFHLKKNWDSKIRNNKEFDTYKGKTLKKEVVRHPNFIKVLIYIGELFQASEWDQRASKFKEFDERIGKELTKWEKEGELCLHLTVISYSLFEKYGVLTDKEMKLVQGYYFHEARKDSPLAMALANIHIGIHSWLSVGGAVIDLTIGQEREFFDFQGMDMIVGEVPEGMTLKGFQEPKKVVSKHIKRYASFLNMTVEEYIDFHDQQAIALLQKHSFENDDK